MPNKAAKNRKRNRLKLNAQLQRLGRTANQVKKRRLKDAKKKGKVQNQIKPKYW